MSKQRKLSQQPGSNPVPPRVSDDLVFARLSERSDEAVEDMAAVLRAINGFHEVAGERALDGQLKSRVAGKFLTLENMTNSSYYARKVTSRRSASSMELEGMKQGKLKNSDGTPAPLTATDLSDLTEIWSSYAKAFFKLLDSLPVSQQIDSRPMYQQKHDLIVRKFEIVGALIEISHSRNSEIIGLKGTVVSEQENSIRIIDEKHKERLIPKNVCTFRVFVGERQISLFGPDIAGIGRSGSMYRKAPAVVVAQELHPLEYS